MPGVFISHRSTDLTLAAKLSADLRGRGHDVWLDDEKIEAGDSIVKAIETGLTDSTYVILCLSSEGPSEWTDREWMPTLARQLSGLGVRLLPVFLSGGTLPTILADIKYVDLTREWDRGIELIDSALK
ncbi:toll/interleukin-1 receptor domain-containing protein [Streptomyces sp. NBC_01210]|uniref:toll/interleukin-1 receptor domain-containing protein n=1 Tax=Streptomyces sp. NBC_01210 TaxID=2903774 RepID=UPI002E1112FC|nr:toll/interleukin-1 receptor domain-containing protein [Streptomyces sp. NBC_01210]